MRKRMRTWKDIGRKLTAVDGRKSSYKVANCVLAALLVLFAFVLLLKIEGMVPFGTNSLCYDDMFYQYNDIFAYMKDCFDGKNSITYTFSKMLGGSSIAVFAYYLSSPFTLLLFFFDKSDVVLYFHLVIGLKLAFIAATTAWFLQGRFHGKLTRTFTVLLSISFALMQYNIAQSCCIMWLDGVYMLPLIVLGVYYLVHDRKPVMLSVCVGLALIFNWYTAVIDVICAFFWLLMEAALELENAENRQRPGKQSLKWFIRTFLLWCAAMLIGAMLSAVLVLPALKALSRNGRGFIDWRQFRFDFKGNIFSAIQNWTLGATSEQGSVALFCGSAALLGTICLFTSMVKTKAHKIIAGVSLIVSLMFYYLNTFSGLYSLGKDVGSYWYRYSYITGILLVFFAAEYFSTAAKEKNAKKQLVRSAVVFALFLLLLNYLNGKWDLKNVYETGIFCVAIAFLLSWYLHLLKRSAEHRQHGIVHTAAAVMTTMALLFELGLNTFLLQTIYSVPDAYLYKDYANQQETQISAIQSQDEGLYRISQTQNFSMSDAGQSAHYDESLAFHYASLATYTSDPNDRQRIFLDRLGYRINGENFNIVNTSILAADSLLGVRYVLSPYEIHGLELMAEMPANGSKQTYRNPYALPMDIVYDGQGIDVSDSVVVNDNMNYYIADQKGNSTKAEDETFCSYINSLYEKLTGEKVNLFVPLKYTREDASTTNIRYTIEIPEGNYALYGNLVWDYEWVGNIAMEDGRNLYYSGWCAPSVFYIPTKSGEASTVLDVTGSSDISNRQEIFAALDLDELKRVTDLLKARDNGMLVEENTTDLTLTVNGNKGESVYLSVPYEEGWEITRNGEKIEPQLFGDCMLSVPLADGENVIELHYHIPYLRAGAACTVLAAAILVFYIVIVQRKSRRSGGEGHANAGWV